MTYPPVVSLLARWVPACVWAVLLVQGCATTAPATAWRPAAINVDGMHRLTVLEFSGENGRAVAASLTARLWDNEFYALVDPSNLAPVRMAAATDTGANVQPADYLDSARSHEVDGLLIGDVIEYRCDDQVLTNTDMHVGSDHTADRRSGVDVGVSHQQTIHREATVAIAFRLVEVGTGKVRATRKTMHNFQGDLVPGQGTIPTSGEVLDELTERCVDEFVATLAPHEVELQLTLARSHWVQRGQALVGKGNDFARRGRWEEAIAAWKQALEANPANDAALYNLAIGHAAEHDYCQAEDFAIQAMNVRLKSLYSDGLEQIRGLASDHEKTLRQRQRTTRLAPPPRHHLSALR